MNWTNTSQTRVGVVRPNAVNAKELSTKNRQNQPCSEMQVSCVFKKRARARYDGFLGFAHGG